MGSGEDENISMMCNHKKIVWVIKADRIKLAGHVAPMGVMYIQHFSEET